MNEDDTLHVYDIYNDLLDYIENMESSNNIYVFKSEKSLNAAFNGINYTIENIIKRIINDKIVLEEYSKINNVKKFILINKKFSSTIIKNIIIYVKKNNNNISIQIECNRY